MFLSRSKQTTELKENSDSFYSLKELVLVFPPLADTASKVRVLMNVTLMGWVTCSWSAQDRMAPLSRPALSSVAARPWWEDRWGQLPLSHLEHTGNTPGTWAWAPPVQPPAASHSPGPAPALAPPSPILGPASPPASFTFPPSFLSLLFLPDWWSRPTGSLRSPPVSVLTVLQYLVWGLLGEELLP